MSGSTATPAGQPTAGVWDVPGQGHALGVLQRAAARAEVGHAWAFTGPPGVGQQRAARILAAALNCPQELAPCGRCDVCARCLRGVHPALSEFAPVGAMHRVSEVREQWLHTASRSPLEGRWKVLHIADADRMNDAAANAFLKGLEEPPPATTWILDVADPDELPDTILSRCREVRFAPWGAELLDAEARRLGLDDDADRRLAVRAAVGTPGALPRLAEPGGVDALRAHRDIPRNLREQGPGFALLAARALDEEVKRRTAVLEEAGKAEAADLDERYGGEAPRAARKEHDDRLARRKRELRTATLQAALDDLLGWYRDCLIVATGGAEADLVPAHDLTTLKADAEAIGGAGLLHAADLILSTREDLELNVQTGLALEALFLDLSTLTLRRA